MRTQSEDTSLAAEKVLIGLLQAATPKRKLAMVLSANRAARALAMTGLKERHPDASADDLRRRLAFRWPVRYHEYTGTVVNSSAANQDDG